MRRAPPIPLFLVEVDPTSAVPLHRQIYFALRGAILSGRLRAGDRVPSSRGLAAALKVARNTVAAALDQLAAEGFLDARPGAGTIVAALPEEIVPASGLPREPSGNAPRRAVSRRAQAFAALGGRERREGVPFTPGIPELGLFPFQEWGRILGRCWRRLPRAGGDLSDRAGYRPLRERIAALIGGARAVRCDPEQVLIVAGAQQALDLAARVLLDPGDTVLIEEPCYPGLRGAFLAAGARLGPVPVDAEGFDSVLAEAMHPEARVACVTPSHHVPLGVTLSLARRLALLDWARRRDGWIVEDDYDSDYRYAGRPLASLQGMDAERRTIYIGTFSKTMFPALRVGYLVVPDDLADAFLAARAVADSHPSAVTQVALAEFLEEGHFARHHRRMRALYAERQAALVEAARAHLAGLLDVAPADSGMHLVGWLPDGGDDAAASSRAAEAGVVAPAVSSYYLDRPAGRPGLMLGYAGFTEADIRRGVASLARALGT